MKTFLYILITLFSIVAISFFLDAAGIVEMKVFGVKREDARRQVFENTQSFVEGQRQMLIRYKLQYECEKDSVVKKALRYTILQSCANLDKTKLEPSLQAFISQLQ